MKSCKEVERSVGEGCCVRKNDSWVASGRSHCQSRDEAVRRHCGNENQCWTVGVGCMVIICSLFSRVPQTLKTKKCYRSSVHFPASTRNPTPNILDHYLLSATNILLQATLHSATIRTYTYFQRSGISLHPKQQKPKLLCPEFRAMHSFSALSTANPPVTCHILAV